jgi:Ran GTPase-activating protein (RanGAP) involved in mRNA processing and transport
LTTNNKVGDEGVKVLADALSTNQCLEILSLGYNEISDEGVIAIAVALRVNNTLKNLTLDVNYIGDKGAISIAFSLKLNHSLKYLNLQHNSEITQQTMQYIASIMSNNAEIKKVLSRSLRHSMNLKNIDEVFDLNPTDDVRNCYRYEFHIQFYLITCYQHYYFNYKPSLHHSNH